MVKIGFVGIGQMGLPLASNLLAAGHEVTAYDLDPKATQALAARGAAIAPSSSALAGEADVVMTALPSPAISETVVTGADGLLAGAREGTIIVELSTISPGVARRLARACAARGIQFLDCGMSGGPGGAKAATLTFMVGGPSDALDKVRPALDAMGRHVYHCGESGAGMAAKLVNNALAHVNALAVCEAFSLGVKNGLDPRVLYEIVENSSGMSWVLPARFREYIQEGRYSPGMTLELLHKDSTLAMEMAHESETPLFLLRLANSLFTWYKLQGLGPRNWAEMMTVWEDQLGIKIGKSRGQIS